MGIRDNPALRALHYHTSGAVARGEKEPIVGIEREDTMEIGDKVTWYTLHGRPVTAVIENKGKDSPASSDHSTGTWYRLKVTATKDPVYKRGERVRTLGTSITKR